MSGDDRVRTCEKCQRTVHNFSAMTRREAELLTHSATEKICAMSALDARGHVVFRADPPSVVQRFVRISMLGLAGLTGAAASETCRTDLIVTDPSGAGVVGAKVSVLQNGKAVGEGNTDTSGHYSSILPAGRYSIEVFVPGFVRFSKEYTAVACEDKGPIQIEAELKLGFVGTVVEVPPRRNVFSRLWRKIKREN